MIIASVVYSCQYILDYYLQRDFVLAVFLKESPAITIIAGDLFGEALFADELLHYVD